MKTATLKTLVVNFTLRRAAAVAIQEGRWTSLWPTQSHASQKTSAVSGHQDKQDSSPLRVGNFSEFVFVEARASLLALGLQSYCWIICFGFATSAETISCPSP